MHFLWHMFKQIYLLCWGRHYFIWTEPTLLTRSYGEFFGKACFNNCSRIVFWWHGIKHWAKNHMDAKLILFFGRYYDSISQSKKLSWNLTVSNMFSESKIALYSILIILLWGLERKSWQQSTFVRDLFLKFSIPWERLKKQY